MSTFEKTYSLPFDAVTAYTHWVSNDTVIPPAASLEIDPQVGGIYRLVMPGGFSMNGLFSRVEPNQALTYSWRWDGDEEATEVAVTFQAAPDGCEVTIVHGEFASSESYDNHANGWDSYIDGFRSFVEARRD